MVARDSIHDPDTLEAAFCLLNDLKSLKSFEMIGFINFANYKTLGRFTSGTYAINPSRIQGWNYMVMNLGS